MMKVNIERRTVDVPASCLPLVSWGYSVEDGKEYISLVGKGW